MKIVVLGMPPGAKKQSKIIRSVPQIDVSFARLGEIIFEILRQKTTRDQIRIGSRTSRKSKPIISKTMETIALYM